MDRRRHCEPQHPPTRRVEPIATRLNRSSALDGIDDSSPPHECRRAPEYVVTI
jgi:hypothetical protein